MKTRLLTFLFLCLLPTFTCAQYKYPYGSDDETVATLATVAPADRSTDDLRNLVRVGRGTNLTKLALRAAGPAGYRKLLQAIEDARMDKQAGSSPSSGGTTNIVSKGVAAQVLSLAVEQGALTRDDSNSVATFRGNAVGIARLLSGTEQFPYCAVFDYSCQSPLAHGLSGASFSVSFNAAPNSDSSSIGSSTSSGNAALLSGSAQQVAGWSLRYDFHVRRNVLAKGYQEQFRAKVASVKEGDAYLAAVGTVVEKLMPSDEYITWERNYIKLLQSSEASGDSGMATVLTQAVDKLVEIAKAKDSNFEANIENLLSKMGTYFGTRDKVLDDVVNRVTYSIEYNNDRPLNQPTQSSARFIVSGRPDAAEKWQLTFNSTIAWYDRMPQQAMVSRFRDAQVALQADRSIGKLDSRLGTAFSAGYYYQYMADDALLNLPSTEFAPGTTIPLPGNASVLLNTKGSIHLGQAQIIFSIRGTGIKIPIALTFSNRTELIKASEVRGHFGITYDLDSLFTRK